MKNLLHAIAQLLTVLALLCSVTESAVAQTPAVNKPKQFIYVLRLVPRLHSEQNWTKEENAALERHLARFKEATEKRQLILAGRTLESGDKTFGIAVFEAKDEAEAKAFMDGDPAIVAGMMTGELHPFAVALQRKNP